MTEQRLLDKELLDKCVVLCLLHLLSKAPDQTIQVKVEDILQYTGKSVTVKDKGDRIEFSIMEMA